MEVCSKCGLSKELCACEALTREGEAITVSKIAKRYGKLVTVVSGISEQELAKKVLRELKSSLACGGTLKDGIIELQGNHSAKIKPLLIKLGFSEEQIEVR